MLAHEKYEYSLYFLRFYCEKTLLTLVFMCLSVLLFASRMHMNYFDNQIDVMLAINYLLSIDATSGTSGSSTIFFKQLTDLFPGHNLQTA